MTTPRSPNRLKASIVDLTFIVWAMIVPTLLPGRLLSSDGDFARHLRMGEMILRHGPWWTDEFAYTHTGPFLTTEWLSQLSWALAHRLGGLAGDAVLAGLIIGTTYALLVAFMRRCGVDPFLAYTAGIVAGVLGAPHWVARPHLFTFLAVPVLLHLALADSKRRIWVFAPFFIIWANFHGGFVLGLAILAALAAGELIEALQSPHGSSQRIDWMAKARFHAMAGAIGAVSSIANPMGVGLPLRIIRVLGNDYLLRSTQEFQSLDFHGTYGRIMIVTIAAMIAILAIRRARLSWPTLSTILMMLAGALTSARYAPLFGMVAVPLLAIECDPQWRSLPVRWISHLRGVFDEGERIAVRGRWAPWFAIIMVLLALNHGTVAGTPIVAGRFDETHVPVAAVRHAREAGLEGRIFNNFVWGGYILWDWPEQRIFIDGMTDFLGNDVMKAYMQIASLDPGWLDTLRSWDVSVVLMPKGNRLVSALLERPDWRTWYEDDVAVILTRGEPVLAQAR